MIYSTGTIAISADGLTITGTGTAWQGKIYPGSILVVRVGSTNHVTVVQAVDSNTSLSVFPALPTGAQTGLAYRITVPTNAAIATDVAETLAIAQEALASYNADDVLAKLKTVDTDTSGLNANTLQGKTAAAFALSGTATPAPQCYLRWTWHTDLTLSPEGGLLVPIQGVVRKLDPNALPIVTTAGLPANYTFFIYAFWDEVTQAIKMEASSVGYIASAITGLPTKATDPSRLLVGQATTTASSYFADSDIQRLTLSYWNRKRKIAKWTAPGVSFTAGPWTAVSGAYHEIACWGDDMIEHAVCVGGSHSISGNLLYGANTDQASGAMLAYAFAIATPSIYAPPISRTQFSQLSEGYHKIVFKGGTGGGTATYDSYTEMSSVVRG
jgi:hypothetical protein